MKHIVLTLIVAALALTGRQTAPTAASGNDKPTTLTLLYTAGATGQVRSCNCTKFRFGGYGRELTLLKSIRGQSGDVLLIEGGDTCGWTGFQAKLKAQITATALKLLGYDAMIPGEEELGVRGAPYVEYFETDCVPIVCANLFDPETDTCTYPPYVIKTTQSGLKVGIIGLLDISVGKIFISKRFEHVVKEPSQVLPALVSELRPKTDLVIVVYHASADRAAELDAIDGIDVVLTTHRSDKNVEFPSTESNRVDVVASRLNNIVHIDACTKANWSLGRIDIELNDNGKIAKAEHFLLYLDRRYEEDPEMVKVYDAYNEEVKKAVLANSDKLRRDQEELLAKRGFDVDEMRERLHRSPFATARKCGQCHEQIHEQWASSPHGTAMKSLEDGNQDYDPECVICHTTGAFVRNGFRNRRDDPELINVQCESCHGPGIAHSKVQAAGYGKTRGEEMCRSCHTKDRTPDFDFATAWAKIAH